MELVKERADMNRKVFKIDGGYRKEWSVKSIDTLEKHVSIMEDLMPGYITNHGWTDDMMYLEVKELPGIPANSKQFKHTPEFVERIVNFCKTNIEQTKPYAHMDWVLSNILIDGDNMYMIDWDNVGMFSRRQIVNKLNRDLKSAFGRKLRKRIII